MLEITPASSQNHATNSPDKTATGVDLAPIIIKPSQLLWRIELMFYCSILCAACIALFPFFLTAFYWPLLWLMFLLLVIFVVYKSWLTQKLPALTFSVQKKTWRLKNPAGEFTVTPVGEFLLWSWVIILPLRNPIDGKKYHVVALKDSMKEEDWRKLRVWLRTGLRNNI